MSIFPVSYVHISSLIPPGACGVGVTVATDGRKRRFERVEEPVVHSVAGVEHSLLAAEPRVPPVSRSIHGEATAL